MEEEEDWGLEEEEQALLDAVRAKKKVSKGVQCVCLPFFFGGGEPCLCCVVVFRSTPSLPPFPLPSPPLPSPITPSLTPPLPHDTPQPNPSTCHLMSYNTRWHGMLLTT